MKHEVLVVGLGYVGLPIAVRAAEAGHHVVGVDVDQKKIHAINSGTSHIEDVSDERLASVIDNNSLKAQVVNGIKTPFDIAIITVPTPVDDLKKPDLRYIVRAAEYVALNLEANATVVLESTTYPGTTEDIVAKVIRDITDMEPGRDYLLGYSPERINPGDTVHTFEHIPKLVAGVNEKSLEVVQAFYDTLVDETVPVSSPRAAELAKVFENTFAQVNIALVNELALVCADLGLDVDEVLDAAATKGHAIMRFRPGPGVGGHSAAPGTLVLTEHGMRAIETIKVGDRVVASDGRLHPVTHIHAHDYDGAMVVLRSRGMPEVRFTTEHKIPVATDSRPLRARAARKGWDARMEREGWRQFLMPDGTVTLTGLSEPKFTEASTVAPERHWMFWPTVAEDSAVEVPEWATEDYIRLAGWYVAEGSTTWHPRGIPTAVTFGLHTDEVEYQREITALLGYVGQEHKVGTTVYPKNHSHVVRYHENGGLPQRLVRDFGRYQHDRVIPNWLLFGPEKNIGSFLRGLLCGDAWLSSREAQLSTTSQDVAYGAVVLLNRLGIPSRVKERKRKNRRPAYEVIVRGTAALSALYEAIGVGIATDDIADPVMYPTRDGKVFRRVQSVHSEPYTGTVYDITVEDDHTFVTPAGVVSNCIAVDPLYLTWMRREHHGKPFKFAELADDINGAMPAHVVKRARNLLLAKRIKMWNARIMVLGTAYKPGVADTRESPAVEVIKLLQEAGAEVLALDPHVNAPEDAERAAKQAGLYDLVIVATDHDEFDYGLIREAAVQILDTRNRYPRNTEKVAKL